MSATQLEIVKTNDELRLVFGWANVTVMDGAEVVDTQNDVMDSQVLVKAFMDFMSASRKGGVMHLRDESGNLLEGGEVVFAFPFTPDIKKAFGIDIPAEGVVIGYHAGEEVWKAVKDGKLRSFSIGGKAVRTPIEEAA
jgi:hypothetical protein